MGTIISLIAAMLPSYTILPLPEWFTTNVINIFSTMKLLLELPILRKLYEYFLIFFSMFLIVWLYNLIIKIISTLGWFNKIDKWQIDLNGNMEEEEQDE